MRVSDAVRVDHEFRHWQKAKNLLKTIDSRLNWYSKHMPDRLTPLHRNRVEEIWADIEEEIASTKLVWKINRYLSRRPLLHLPTSEILNYIYEGLPPPKQANLTDMEQALSQLLKEQYWQAQKDAHYFGLMCEVAMRAKQGWFIVFNTLTVAPGTYVKVFSKDNRSYRTYLREIDRAIATASYGSIRAAQGKLYHLYFGAIESGSLRGRLHIHSLHLCRHIPSDWADPNYGQALPSAWNIARLRRYWPHGRADCRPGRYSPDDAYGRKGWRWPLDYKTGQPYQVRSPLALANYISKYITKGYDSCQRKKYLWRVRKSHNLGRALMDEIAARLSISTLLILATSDAIKAKINNTPIPSTLLRLACLRSLKNRNFQDTTNLSHYRDLTTLAKLTTSRLSPLHALRASIQTITTNSQLSMQYLAMLGLTSEAAFNAAAEDLRNSVWQADQDYFPPAVRTWGTASSRDDIIIRTKPNENATGGPQTGNRRPDKAARQSAQNVSRAPATTDQD